jgi:hypothetical protein
MATNSPSSIVKLTSFNAQNSCSVPFPYICVRLFTSINAIGLPLSLESQHKAYYTTKALPVTTGTGRVYVPILKTKE